MCYEVDLRVVHIPGQYNEIADALLQFHFQDALQSQPTLVLTAYQPPAMIAGAVAL